MVHPVETGFIVNSNHSFGDVSEGYFQDIKRYSTLARLKSCLKQIVQSPCIFYL